MSQKISGATYELMYFRIWYKALCKFERIPTKMSI